MKNVGVRTLPYPERVRLYSEAKKALYGLSASEYEKAIKALADYFGI